MRSKKDRSADKPSSNPNYVGRFAPSPTGPLHFGSLVAALASYLDARANGGRWLLRLEDLDPPREMPGATDAIITSLEKHHLVWDGDILFQSQRADAYADTLARLDNAHLIYPCYCSRKTVTAAGGIYPGTCRRDDPPVSAIDALHKSNRSAALRLKTSELPPPFSRADTEIPFNDLIFGPQQQNLPKNVGDFVIRRKDGFIAYQLAVVVDDIAQGITHVIRGSDLLSSTAQQIFLFHLLGAPTPAYGHIPVVVDKTGQKLSKQQGARPVDDTNAEDNLIHALKFLGQTPPRDLYGTGCDYILHWATTHWDRGHIPLANLPIICQS